MNPAPQAPMAIPAEPAPRRPLPWIIASVFLGGLVLGLLLGLFVGGRSVAPESTASSKWEYRVETFRTDVELRQRLPSICAEGWEPMLFTSSSTATNAWYDIIFRRRK